MVSTVIPRRFRNIELITIPFLIGTLLAIQNMTWNGAQGFSAPPSDDLYIPEGYWNLNYDYVPGLAATGIMGKTRTERGLTWVEAFSKSPRKREHRWTTETHHVNHRFVPHAAAVATFCSIQTHGIHVRADR